jgi:hypothetical protein
MSTSLAVVLLATSMRLVASHDVSRSGYADGAPPGFSGGFKEDSCQACHFHEALNAAPGKLAIEGLPATFVAGERYTLTISLTRDGMKLSGFQLAARFKDTGAQAGTLAAAAEDTERIKIESSSSIQYAGHTLAGSKVSEAGVARWVVQWTAPSSGGAVIFNVSANAANGDERVDGDFIYSACIETAPPP